MRSTWLPPVALCLAMVLAGCGTPGAPQPPSLELPRPVRDLSAARKGDRVTLTWTPSRENTDHSRVKHPGKTVICRGVDAVAMLGCRQTVGEIAPAQLPATGAATFTRSSSAATVHV